MSPEQGSGCSCGALWEGWGCQCGEAREGEVGGMGRVAADPLARPCGDLALLLQALNRLLAPSWGL